jgi:sugar phosphate isomerase/epimerase
MNELILAPTTLMETPPLPFLAAAAQAGYDGVGLRLQKSPHLPIHPVVGNAPLIRDMRRMIADNGFSVLDIMSFYMLPDTDIGAFMPAIALSAEFGAKYLVVQGNDPEWNRMVDNFARFCEAAAPFGLAAGLEFMPARVLDTLERALKLRDDAGRENAIILVDPLHLIRAENTAADLTKVDPKLFPFAQMSDGVLTPGEPDLALAKRIGTGERRMPGEGTLPLREIFAALPPDLPLSVEVVMPIPAGMSEAAFAQRVIDKTRAWLDGA